MIKKYRLHIAVLLSLLLHILTGGALWLQPKSSPTKHQYVDIQMLDDKLKSQLDKSHKKIDGQIVSQNEKSLNDETPDKAKFLSQHNQRVEKETRAEQFGKFKNASELGSKATQHKQNAGSKTLPAQVENTENNKNQNEVAKSDTQIQTDEASDVQMSELNRFKPSFKRDQSVFLGEEQNAGEASTTDDHLKDVQTGVQTLLSTREFVYYTYYNRIKDKLRQYWEPKIREKVSKIVRQGRTIASTSEKITKIVIILDRKGVLEKIQVIGPSGLEDLDDAAVEAFRAAAPFPNPPKGIVEDDGKIRIRWDFILEA